MSSFHVGDRVRSVRGACSRRVGIVVELRSRPHGNFLMVKFRHEFQPIQKSVKNVTLHIPAHLRMDKGL